MTKWFNGREVNGEITEIALGFMIRCISKDNEKIFNKQGRPFTSKKYKDFEKVIQLLAKQQYKGKPLTGDLFVKMDFYFRTKVRCDLTNCPKGVLDSLQGIAFINDKQIVKAELNVITGVEDKFYVEVKKL